MNPSRTPAPTPLRTLAQVVRSKNAELTLDLFLQQRAGLRAGRRQRGAAPGSGGRSVRRCAAGRAAISAAAAARDQVQPAAVCAGTPGDGDLYGAQQHAPLLELML
jgi:hypothetical protein